MITTAILLSISVFFKQPTAELKEQTIIDLNDTSIPPSIPVIPPTPAQQPEILYMPNIIKFPESGIPVLMYHSISTVPGNSLCVPPKQFLEEIEWLYQQNYHTLTIEEFYQALGNNISIPEKSILLTFDDGYADNYKVAWPILHKYGFIATFFIITKYVSPKAMDWTQLKELVRDGNSIGSHTVRHLDLSTLTTEQQKNELADSKRILENHLGISIKALCFPSGMYNNTTLELMPDIGYELGFSTHSGRIHLDDDIFTLKRLRISAGLSHTEFQKLLATDNHEKLSK
ncbi:MAG: polysaccharide deacetylase family protein [Erysipelotrichia bacterium]|nr:polysaccharide deacetylase family protein [Erysipelotrichia bacterium]